ncbi:MAG: 4'-phosphopantetheinyl transferase superfamily protein [Bifidobacteriaceae bacterium]|jgi:holo-[acyl-carrier protein] synthase|nr:4'-phosphopantetheinyl transferase superfamily protein [Bifidobacteriaceae bacterium]
MSLIKGVGVDLVCVSDVAWLIETLGEPVLARVFSAAELRAAREAPDPAASLAGRFAVKEAVFKAVAHHTPAGAFDLRMVESANEPDGCPRVNINDCLRAVLDRASVADLHISLTTESGHALAVALATAPQ